MSNEHYPSGDLELISLVISEFVQTNHRSDYVCSDQCRMFFDTTGDFLCFHLEGANAMKVYLESLPSFAFDGDKLILRANPERVVLVKFD